MVTAAAHASIFPEISWKSTVYSFGYFSYIHHHGRCSKLLTSGIENPLKDEQRLAGNL